ncbi:MAG TPA: hypothetical protein VHN99_07295 [Deinococcales bacterium]|nr:hypothetical protein [Deinococcales bacterium]
MRMSLAVPGFALAAVLVGCGPSGLTGQLVVNYPAGGLPLGLPVQLTASVLDSTGASRPAPAGLRWSSSDPDRLSVDTGGVATSHHLGVRMVSVYADGYAGGAAAMEGTGMEACAGVLNDAQVGHDQTTFAFVINEDLDPSEVSQPDPWRTVSVTGPAGWNGGQAFAQTEVPDGRLVQVDAAPLDGEYVVTVRGLDGKDHARTVRLDTSRHLAAPIVTGWTPGPNFVGVDWQAVPGAVNYHACAYDHATLQRLDAADESVRPYAWDYAAETGTHATLRGDLSALPGTVVDVGVEAFSFRLTGPSPEQCDWSRGPKRAFTR